MTTAESYAIRVTDPSMAPRYRVGEMLYINPGRDVKNGDDVLVQFKCEQPNSINVLVARLVRRTVSSLVLAHYNPPKQFEIPIDDDVVAIHRIVGVGEGSRLKTA